MMSKPDYSKPVKGENIGYLLSFIGELEHREFSKLEAFAFQQPLDDMTLGQALKAVVEWHKTDHGFNQIAPWNINEIVRAWKRKNLPDEGQITREIVKLGLSAEQPWQYRRQRLLGKQLEEAARVAQSTGNPLFLEPREPKKRVNNRQIARRMEQAGKLPLETVLNQNHKNDPQTGEQQ